jgi:hypothetical protein
MTKVRHARELPAVKKTDFPVRLNPETEPIARIDPVSYNMCARINALIDRRWSSIHIYAKVDGYAHYVEILEMKPAERLGFILCKCSTIFGERYIEIGAGYSFDLRVQVR